MNRKGKALFLCFCFHFITTNAANIVWTNTVSGNWNTVANWNPNQTPTTGDDVLITNGGTYTVTVNVAANLSSLTVGAGSGIQTITNNGQTITLANASFIGTNAVVGFASGTLTGGGNLNVAGRVIWNSGTMSGASSTIIEETGLLTMGGTGKTLSGRTIVNQGQIVWSAGTISTASGAVISNAPSGLVNLTGDVSTTAGAGNRTIINAGTWRKTTGAGTSTFSEVFQNIGSLEVQSGTVSLSGTATHAGAISIAGGSVMTLSGTQVITNNASVSGAGTLQFTSGTLNCNGSYAITNGAFQMSGGVAAVNASGLVVITNLSLTGGTLGGSNQITVLGTMTWGAGNFSGSNVVAVLGNLTMNGGSRVISGRTVINYGTATWSVGQLSMGAFSVFSNAPSGTLDVTFDAIVGPSVSGRIANSGLFRKTAGTGALVVPEPFQNSGIVQVDSGGLFFSSASAVYLQTAGTTFLNGGNITNVPPLQILGGELVGTGTISGSVTNNGLFSPGTSPGLLTISSNYVQTTNGSLNIDLGGTSPGTGFDRLVIGGNARLAGTVRISITNGFAPSNDTSLAFITCLTRSNTFNVFQNLSPARLALLYSNNAVVAEISPPPVFSNSPSPIAVVLDTIYFSAVPVESSAYGFTYTLLFGPPGATVNPTNGIVSWTPSFSDALSTNSISVLVSDNFSPGSIATNTFSIIVNPVDQTPTLKINQVGTNVMLSWHTARLSYDLEYSDILSPPFWHTVDKIHALAGLHENVMQDIGHPERYFRLRPASTTPPSLSGVFGSSTVSMDGAGMWGFNYYDPDGDITAIEFIHISDMGISTNTLPAWLYGVTNFSGSLILPLQGSTLPFGANTLLVRLLDSGGHFSDQLSFSTTVTGENTTGTDPTLGNLSSSPPSWNRPTGSNDIALTMVSFSYHDADADITRFRMVVTGPTGVVGFSEMNASSVGIVGTNGQITLPALPFHSWNALGSYSIALTAIDGEGHLSPPTNIVFNLVANGGAIPLRIISFSPTNGDGGSLVTLSGTGFDTNIFNNFVELNSMPLNVASATLTNLVVEIPFGAGSGRFVVQSTKGSAVGSKPFVISPKILLSPTNESVVVGSSLKLDALIVSSFATQLVWTVNGEIGGNASDGTITQDGVYTAPPDIPSNQWVIVAAEIADNPTIWGETYVRILPPLSTPGSSTVLSSAGGIVRSHEGRAMIQFQSGSLVVSTQITVLELHGPNLPPPPLGRRSLGAVEFGPSGLNFSPPALVTIPLSRAYPAGTQLPLQFYNASNGTYSAETLMATVTRNGDAATALISHFSTALINDAAPANPPASAPVINNITPSDGFEGMRIPIFITGSGLTSDLDARVFSGGNDVSAIIEPETLYVASSNAAVVLHIHSITDLPEGQDRTYELRLRRPGGASAGINFTVHGLFELVVPAGQTVELTNPSPMTNSEVHIDGTVRILSGTLNIQASGDVTINGILDAKGADGASATNSEGGARGLHGGAGGKGRYSDCDVGEFGVGIGCGPKNDNFGENGNDCIGHSAENSVQQACRDFVSGGGRTIPMGMGGNPGENFNAFGQILNIVREIGDCAAGSFQDCALAVANAIGLAQEIANIGSGSHVGRRGYGAVPSNLQVPEISDLAETGGGGGGGGGNILAKILGTGIQIHGGGGGAGGDGGRRIRIATPGIIDVSNGTLSSAGGNGGDGSTTGRLVVSAPFVDDQTADGIPAIPGGGGGGGAGGVVILSGAQVLYPSIGRISAEGGKAGSGGFVYVDEDNGNFRNGFRSDPASDGPAGARLLHDSYFWNEDHTAPIQRMITTHQLLRARINDPNPQPSPVHIEGENGQARDCLVFEGEDGLKYSDLVFFPGFNTVGVSGGFSELRILVLVVDSDGDSLSDDDETERGTNPGNPDTDSDGLTDGDEVFNRNTDPTKLDTDGDGIADGAELLFLNTNPTAPDSNVSVPAGTFFVNVRNGMGFAQLALLNPQSGAIAVLGQPNSGSDFGMTFDGIGNAYFAEFQQVTTTSEPMHAPGGVIATTSLGTFGSLGGQAVHAWRLAYNPITFDIFGIEVGASSPYPPTGQLIKFTPCGGPTGVVRVGTNNVQPYHALAFNDGGELFATVATSDSDHLVRINPITGVVVQDIGSIGFTNVNGLAFDLNDDLFGTTTLAADSSSTLAIDKGTGAGTVLAHVNAALYDLTTAPCPSPCFVPPGTSPTMYGAGEQPLFIKLADVNGDSYQDIIVLNQSTGFSGGQVSVLLGLNDGTFSGANHIDLDANGAIAHDLAIADVDDDGSPDILVTTSKILGNVITNNYVTILKGDGSGDFDVLTHIQMPATHSPYAIATGDFDNDGEQDFVAGYFTFPGNASAGYDVFSNTGNGTFIRTNDQATSGRPITILSKDLDHDGHMDIVEALYFVSGNKPSGNVEARHGSGTGSFAGTSFFTLGVKPLDSIPVWLGDVNGDGEVDLLTVTSNMLGVRILLGDGAAHFGDAGMEVYPPLSLSNTNDVITSIATADFTGDGRADLIVGTRYGETVMMPEDCGNTFTGGVSYQGGEWQSSMAVADFNHDGHPDVAIANFVDGTVTVMLSSP